MSYGPNTVDAYCLHGLYAGRVLNGGKPGELPIRHRSNSGWFRITALFAAVRIVANGTNRTNRVGLMMSVVRGRSEVAFRGRQGRILTRSGSGANLLFASIPIVTPAAKTQTRS